MKVILDLCAGTGAWSQPYKDAGYKVHRITLPHYDVTQIRVSAKEVVFLSQSQAHSDIVVKTQRVHGILAAPPCTLFSLARTRAMEIRPDWATALVPVRSCQRIVWACMCRGWTKFWAVENPVGHLRKFLGRPQFSSNAWQYGEMWSKRTDLWGYFEHPKPLVLQRPPELDSDAFKWPEAGSGYFKLHSDPICPPEYAGMGLTRADLRAITPKGFAQQFYKANR